MQQFSTKELPESRDATAPDGSEVRLLLDIAGRGGMAHFSLAPGKISLAVTHRTVEEIWYCLSGKGRMWREQDGYSEIIEMRSGVSLTIPIGTKFQFRTDGNETLSMIGVTMPPWPGEGEAVMVQGHWNPDIS